ncbi:hypothetical protein [Nannocystis sp. SCPEA4]|uniref:hypothetical protein n=1 Tax=Nannocystis sp. SCPEA4 TaxID=2996787 RepID=UPI00226EE38B|nr:hypothetical protein [Nannocystis sp. SCPEA4]MCY1062098.1 hypothetical protein [Nannocystis sp. SCPEA4]
MHRFSSSARFFSAVLALGFVGCDGVDTDDAPEIFDDSFVQDGAGEFTQAPAARPEALLLAEISLPNDGGSLRFIDESRIYPGGGIGLFHTGSSRSLVAQYGELYGASPLEIFTALAPDADAPERLFEDHEARIAAGAGLDAEPRMLPGLDDLKANVEPLLAIAESPCDPAGTDYHADFVILDGSRANHGHGWDQSGDTFAYTAASTTRALGLCVRQAVGALTVRMNIEIETGVNVWTLVDTALIDVGDHGFYESSGLSSARYRVKGEGDVGELYHLEGSW